LEPVGNLGLKAISLGRREQAARELAEEFEVNPKVASIRLDNLFPASNQAEL
jgi:hypothetical protein